MKRSKIIKIIISSLFGIIFALALYFIISNTIKLQKNELGSFFGYSVSYVPTESMEPVIEAESTIIFKKTDYADANVGDIIVYYNDELNIYVIHEIYEETEYGFIMKGVNNNSIDLYSNGNIIYVTEDNFYGTYVKTLNILSLKSIATNREYIFGVCIIIFILAFISEGLSIYKTYKKEKRKEENAKVRDELIEEIKEELRNELKEKNKQ